MLAIVHKKKLLSTNIFQSAYIKSASVVLYLMVD